MAAQRLFSALGLEQGQHVLIGGPRGCVTSKWSSQAFLVNVRLSDAKYGAPHRVDFGVVDKANRLRLATRGNDEK